MTQIISLLKSNNIKPYIQSVLKVNYPQEEVLKKNIIIDQLNDQLYELTIDEKIEFIDLNKLLSDVNGLKKEFTKDGVHLNSSGYLEWSTILFKIFDELGYYNN